MSWITFTYGRPGEGKSLDTAKTVLELFEEYERIEKKYPKIPKRVLWSNMKFSKEIEKKYLHKKLEYWENPRQLYNLKDVDIIWDEIARHLPADKWGDTPDELRTLFAQHRKKGIRIFANTQDYKAVDINFRRMVGTAYKVKKIIGSRDISVSLPPVKYIWGVILKREFNPEDIETEKDIQKLEQISLLPKIIFIRKKYIKTYDTRQIIPKYRPKELEHIEYTCQTCGYVKTEHRKL